MGLQVRRKEAELVVPAAATPHETKELSDIDDQEALRFQVPLLLAFKKPKGIMDPVAVIRGALAKTLVYYYPFAGRIREGLNRKLAVDCTAEGALFIEANADATLDELINEILPPCSYLEELLFDIPRTGEIIGCPLLLFQVTRLKCGGFIVGIRFSHNMCDVTGMVQLLNAMTEISKGAHAPSVLPTWERDLLRARNPPRVTCRHPEYQEENNIINDLTMMEDQPHNKMVQAAFYFNAKDIESLGRHLPPHLHPTKFELMTACIWRCRTMALNPDPRATVFLSFVVNLRGQRHLVPISTPGYYGNALVFPAVTTTASSLIDGPLDHTLELVKQAKAMVTPEYLRSVMDLMVMKGRLKYKTSILNWIPSKTTRIGLEGVDFGFEASLVYGGIPRAVSIIMSNFTMYRNEDGEEMIVVPLCLPMRAMVRFKEELARVMDSTDPTMLHDFNIVTSRL